MEVSWCPVTGAETERYASVFGPTAAESQTRDFPSPEKRRQNRSVQASYFGQAGDFGHFLLFFFFFLEFFNGHIF